MTFVIFFRRLTQFAFLHSPIDPDISNSLQIPLRGYNHTSMQYMTQISERGHNPCQLWPPHVGLPQQPKSTSEDGSDGKVGVGSTQRAVHDRHRPSTSHYTSTISYLKVVSTARWIQPRRPFAGDTSKKVYKIPWKTIFSR